VPPEPCQTPHQTDSDWSIKALLKPIANKLRKRAEITTFEWIKGHNGTTGNEGADHLAAEGARKYNNLKTLFIPSPELNYSGTRLASLSQKDTYKLIFEQPSKT